MDLESANELLFGFLWDLSEGDRLRDIVYHWAGTKKISAKDAVYLNRLAAVEVLSLDTESSPLVQVVSSLQAGNKDTRPSGARGAAGLAFLEIARWCAQRKHWPAKECKHCGRWFVDFSKQRSGTFCTVRGGCRAPFHNERRPGTPT